MSETIETYGTRGTPAMPSTSGASNLSTTAPSPEPRGKILRFPTLNAESGVAAAGGAESAPVRRGLLAASSAVEESDSAALRTATAAWQRLATMRRRRPSRSADNGSEGEAGGTAVAPARPTVSQLVTWMLNLRRGGVGFLYWNAAKLPMDVALMRAARLDDGAIIDVAGHKLLVVEPMRPAAGAAQVR